jgi:hypothetical protein
VETRPATIRPAHPSTPTRTGATRMSDLTLITQYGDIRLTSELVDRDLDDDSEATVQLVTYAPVRIALDAPEARRLAGKLLDYADELDRQNSR